MYFSHLGVFLKALTTENTENKTTPKVCKITELISCESNNSLPATWIVKYSRIMRAWINSYFLSSVCQVDLPFERQGRDEVFCSCGFPVTLLIGSMRLEACCSLMWFQRLLAVLPLHFNVFWQSLHVTVPAALFFSKCFYTCSDDELAGDLSIATTGYFPISGFFCVCRSALVARIIWIMKRSSNNDGRIVFNIQLFDLFFSPLVKSTLWNSLKGNTLNDNNR